MTKNFVEIWGINSYRSLRVIWILEEFNISYTHYKIGSRTGETQKPTFLKLNPKGKIPVLKHNKIIITESIAAVNYIAENFKCPEGFLKPTSKKIKAKIDEWSYFSAMELDCLSIYILRKHGLKKNLGLSSIYGGAPNAVKAAKEHFYKMISSCESNIPKKGWLLGKKFSVADIIFISCLYTANKFNLEINSKIINSYLNRVKNKKSFLRDVNVLNS